jgi:uncharacterized membrane protein
MTTSSQSESGEGLGKQRIEGLSDGIFAFAMTLLVLDVKIPKIAGLLFPDQFLAGKLVDLWPKFLSFAMSFIILGVFWIAHHGYSHFLKRTDRYFLWISLLFLMVVVFVPFSTDLLGDYPKSSIAVMVYGCNILALGLTLYWQWWYATKGHRLVPPNLEPELIRRGKDRILAGILTNICAVLLAQVNPLLSLGLYILFPIVYLLPSRIDRHWTHPHD